MASKGKGVVNPQGIPTISKFKNLTAWGHGSGQSGTIMLVRAKRVWKSPYPTTETVVMSQMLWVIPGLLFLAFSTKNHLITQDERNGLISDPIYWRHFDEFHRKKYFQAMARNKILIKQMFRRVISFGVGVPYSKWSQIWLILLPLTSISSIYNTCYRAMNGLHTIIKTKYSVTLNGFALAGSQGTSCSTGLC